MIIYNILRYEPSQLVNQYKNIFVQFGIRIFVQFEIRTVTIILSYNLEYEPTQLFNLEYEQTGI